MKKTVLLTVMGAAILSVLAFGGVATAGKRSNAVAGASISINQSGAHLGDWVTFTYSVPSTVTNPRIQVMCYQNGAIVYGEAGPAGQSFLLGGGGSVWRTGGGAANCTATLYEWDWHPVQRFVPYAAASFDASGAR